MSELINTSKRQLIPRWHTSRKLNFIRQPIVKTLDNSENTKHFRIDEKKSAWIDLKSISSALDLFVSLNLANLTSDPFYTETRNYLSKNSNIQPSVKNILNPKLVRLDNSNNYTTNKERIQEIIRTLKRFLHECPYDSLSWNDLAFYYTILSERHKAEHCMKIAFNLAKSHPFIARSYARMLVHYDEPEKAIHILNQSNKIDKNPEILSAEISIRSTFRIGQPNITQARKLIDRNISRPQCISELSASIGTIEAENASIKKAKEHLKTSSLSPTENTIAQLKWMSQQHKITIPVSSQINSIEATAISHYNNKKYLECRDDLMTLHRFQPFSEIALVDAGYLSLVALDDPQFVCEFSEYFGNDVLESFKAKNNYIASKLIIGDIEDAPYLLKDLSKLPKDDRERAVLSATMGMYLYRTNNPVSAKEYYDRANTYFKATKDDFSLALSLLHQGIVEKDHDTSIAKNTLLKAQKEAKKIIKSPELLEKVNREIKTIDKSSKIQK